jgi:S1-C subfamily serine protease
MSSASSKRIVAAFLSLALATTVPAAVSLAAEKEDQSVDMDEPSSRGDDDDSASRSSRSSRGYLGVSVQRLRHSLKNAFDIPDNVNGLIISKVHDDTPADRAGLRDKDVIVRFNGKSVDSEDGFTRMIRATRPGSQATITVWRDGKTIDLTATMAPVSDGAWSWSDDDGVTVVPTPRAAPVPPVPPQAFSMFTGDHGHMGVHLQDLNPEIAEYFSAPGARGALVWEVVEDSPAEVAGIKAGDIVVGVEGKDVSDSQDLREILSDFEAEETVSVRILRRGREQTLQVTLDERDGAFSFGSMRLPRGNFMNRRGRVTERSTEQLQEELDRLQERIGELREDLQRLKD